MVGCFPLDSVEFIGISPFGHFATRWSHPPWSFTDDWMTSSQWNMAKCRPWANLKTLNRVGVLEIDTWEWCSFFNFVLNWLFLKMGSLVERVWQLKWDFVIREMRNCKDVRFRTLQSWCILFFCIIICLQRYQSKRMFRIRTAVHCWIQSKHAAARHSGSLVAGQSACKKYSRTGKLLLHRKINQEFTAG